MKSADNIMKAYLKVVCEQVEGSSDLLTKNITAGIEKAVQDKQVVNFMYRSKTGNVSTMKFLPISVNFSKYSTDDDVMFGYINGVEDPKNKRKLFINSIVGELDESKPFDKRLKDAVAAVQGTDSKVLIIIGHGIEHFKDYYVFERHHKRYITLMTDRYGVTFELDTEAPQRINLFDPKPNVGEAVRINGKNDKEFAEGMKANVGKPIVVRVRANDTVKDYELIVWRPDLHFTDGKHAMDGVGKDENGLFTRFYTLDLSKMISEDEDELEDDPVAYRKKFAAKMAEYKESLTPEERDACKNWGALNGHDEEDAKEFNEASKIHARLADENPAMHSISSTDTIRGYHEYHCSCGFGYWYDSSD